MSKCKQNLEKKRGQLSRGVIFNVRLSGWHCPDVLYSRTSPIFCSILNVGSKQVVKPTVSYRILQLRARPITVINTPALILQLNGLLLNVQVGLREPMGKLTIKRNWLFSRCRSNHFGDLLQRRHSRICILTNKWLVVSLVCRNILELYMSDRYPSTSWNPQR